MSIADELNALRTNINASYSAVEGKGGEVPTNKNTDNLPGAINSIPTGSGGSLPAGFPQSIYPGTENPILTFPDLFNRYIPLKYLACNNYNQYLYLPESTLGFYKLVIIFSAEYPTGTSEYGSTLWLVGPPNTVTSSENNDWGGVGAALKTGNIISGLTNARVGQSGETKIYNYYLGENLNKNCVKVPNAMNNLDAPTYLTIMRAYENKQNVPAGQEKPEYGVFLSTNYCSDVLTTTSIGGGNTDFFDTGSVFTYKGWQIGRAFTWSGSHPELRIYGIRFYYNISDYYELFPVANKTDYAIPVSGWLMRRVRPNQPNDLYQFIHSGGAYNGEYWIMGPEL